MIHFHSANVGDNSVLVLEFQINRSHSAEAREGLAEVLNTR